ncbi:MAG: transforming growth factor-beta-induced protein [Candidatus Pelagisphaera sp.]|jgi:transforming growth factor-beta-induced protein
MKKIAKIMLAVFGLVQLTVGLKAAELNFGGAIDGVQSGTGSAASGSATLTLDTDSNTFDLSINISNLRNDLSASHIHVGASGETGGVLVGIGDMSTYTVIGDFYVLEMTNVEFPAENLVDLLAGNTYLNFHTPQFGSGEVRGQLNLTSSESDSLVNISTRGLIDPALGDEATLIAGFSVAETKRVILRGIGESLSLDGVNAPLEDIAFDVYSLDFVNPENTVMIAENDNWKDDGQQYQIAATGLPPRSDSDAAMIMTLEPGTYTLNAKATSGEGVALVEVFGLDTAGVGSTIAAAAKEGPSQSFTLLNAALGATGLDVILDSNGPFTLFAPTDEAFLASFTAEEITELVADDADKDADLAALTEILLYHVVGGNIPSSALVAGANTVVALNSVNFTVNVTENGVTAQNGNVLETDIPSSNGVTHVVDAILAPFGVASEIGNNPNLSILNAAISAASLSSVLDGDGSFTLFAPSNEAFLKMFTQEELDELLADDADKEEDLAALAGILSYHVAEGKILSSDIAEGTNAVPALTGLGLNVTLEDGMVGVQDSKVTQADLIVGNGVIHIVDSVLAPYGIGSTLAAGGTMPSFTILSAALEATGLDAVLDGAGAFTLFAPTDEAFLDIFSEEDLAELLADDADKESDLEDLAAILSYHVVGSQILSTDLAEGVNTAPALTGVNLYVSLIEGSVTVQDAGVTEANILASNGVIHAVNAVLTPSGIGSTIGSGGTPESYTILSAALQATGLDVALDGEGMFTLFAPNDAAFLAAFTQEALEELLADDADMEDDLAALAGILSYHVVIGEIRSTDLAEGVNTAASLTGTNVYVTLTEGAVTVQEGTVIEADLLAGNGVIHTVNSILSPSGVGSTIAINGLEESFAILGAALAATDLVTALDAEGSFTLFAPTDAAFLAAFTQEALDELLADDADKEADLAALAAILTYHVVPSKILSTDLDAGVNTVEALNEEDLDVTVGETVTAGNATVIGFDILAGNGVIHVLDAVLELP